MKTDIKFQIECTGKDGSIWSVVFFPLHNGNIGIEIRTKGSMVACLPEGEKVNEMRRMINVLA